MSNRKYIALTLGPIYRTMRDLRKTRAVFAGSYLFSYIMKQLIVEMGKKGVEINNILLPNLDAINNIAPGVGLYPDRLIMTSKSPDDFQRVIDAKTAVINHLGSEISKAIHESATTVTHYLTDFLKIYILEVELPQSEETINTLNSYLDSLELADNFPVKDEDYLAKFLNETTGLFLIRDAFGKGKDRFKSLIEIATVELKRVSQSARTESVGNYNSIVAKHLGKVKNTVAETEPDIDEDDEESIVKELRTVFPNEFRAYHKYVAILNIDGDRIGKYIESLAGNDEALKQFSKNLLDFGLQANKLILDYGGSPVYIGGDDLLFFAPVVSLVGTDGDKQRKQTVFELIHQLDDLFYTFFPITDGGSPTLSCGLSISYYKYPLNEAVKKSESLMYAAKTANEKRKSVANPNASTLNFEFLKGGGSSLSGTLLKENREFFKAITKFIDANSEKDEQLLTSLIQGFSENYVMMTYLCGVSTKAAREGHGATLDNWFLNNFNEDIHSRSKAFITNELVPFIENIYAELQNDEEAFSLISSLLKTIRFLKSKDDER